jgi:hypothetical protein
MSFSFKRRAAGVRYGTSHCWRPAPRQQHQRVGAMPAKVLQGARESVR